MLSGQRLLDVDGLQERLQGLCQWRIDSGFLDQIDFAMHDDLKLRAVDSSRGAAIVGA